MKIAVVCGSGPTFIEPIMEHWREAGHEVVTPEQWPVPCDIIWVEWCDDRARIVAQSVKRVPIVIRLHSYEAFTPFPAQVKWWKVDDLVFVAPHVRDYVTKTYQIEGPKIHVVPNALDLALWPERNAPIRGAGEGRRIAWVGGISHKKGPDLFAQAALRLLLHDPSCTIHIAGDWQDPRYQPYIQHMIPDRLGERIEYHGNVPYSQMAAWLGTMDCTLSTSPWESFQYAVAEGVTAGLLPLVHDWPGAEEVYPFARRWRTVEDLAAAYDAPWTPEDAAGARAWLLEKHDAEARFAEIDQILEDRVRAGFVKRLPTVAVAMPVGGTEPRFEAAVRSVAGHVNEIQCHIDDRRGAHNVEVAKQLQAEGIPLEFTVGPPPMYGEAIDFSAVRNLLADRCTSDWIFVLDSDEQVENPALIRPILLEAEHTDPPHDSLAVKVKCFTDAGLTETAHDLRCYRREKCTDPQTGEHYGLRYRYPVHNQLGGSRYTYGCDVCIRSTYVGGLNERVERSIPPLLQMHEEATAALEAGEQWVVNGEEYEPERAQGHATFFLCRMYTVANDRPNAMKWYERCRETCGKEKYAAPMWKWFALTVLDVSGITASEAIIDEGLKAFPYHTDLYHIRAGIDLLRVARTGINQMAMVGVPMSSRECIEKIPEAIKLLGIPVQIELRRQG